ncbi:hypothetical protein C8Q79DRAFT_1013538 [Trametes meyenii]|nr:hypothetical protein C8Q79DRAFT_1013538 [Trametes meyenii]
MHHALLIDEILQLVFDFCTELPEPEPRWTLCQLARCCRAWKDPALDRLWSRIDGVAPLVSLLPCASGKETGILKVSSAFSAYAQRVKEMISHHSILRTPSLDPSMVLMPRLEAVTLSFHGCMIPNAWITSPHLRRISVNIGFAYDPQATIDRSNMVADYLQQVRRCAPNMRSLQIRGRMTEPLNIAVASMNHLRDVTIHGNCFFTGETLAAMATFPNLRILNVHANAIQHADFEDALSRHPGPYFPALEVLDIRTSRPLLSAVLEHLCTGVLTKLRADVRQCSHGRNYVKGVFELLARKMADSLKELDIEDVADYDEDSTHDSPMPPSWYSISTLSPLAVLKQLRRFAIHSVLPPDLSDSDVGLLGKWWPSLQHLHLGAVDTDCLPPEWQARMTPAVFGVVAQFLPHLETLALPILPVELLSSGGDLTTSNGLVRCHKTLRSLAIGDVPDGSACASTLVTAILTAFPSLTTLDCPTHEVTERFSAVTTNRAV